MNPEDLPSELNEPIEFPHRLDREFNALVVANHKYMLEGIEREEDKDRKILDKDEFFYQQTYYDDLRTTANNLAVVVIVTRIDYWVTHYCEALGIGKHGSIIQKMERLNRRFQNEPVPIKFFNDLVNARDSVIHGNSKSEWQYKVPRTVADEHKNFFDELEVSSWQVDQAVRRSIEQLKWYEEQITAEEKKKP